MDTDTATDTERIHHVSGKQRRVAIPDYLRAEIRRHDFHRSDAEVIIFHNHTGDEPEWFYTLKSLLQDLPIASIDDRRQLQNHASNLAGLSNKVSDRAKCFFILVSAGSLSSSSYHRFMPFLEQLNRIDAHQRV